MGGRPAIAGGLHHPGPGIPTDQIYPNLLRGVKVDWPNQVWAADITFVPMASSFMYLAAVIHWYSRYTEAVPELNRGLARYIRLLQ